MNPDRDEAEYWASSEFIILRSTFPNPAVIKPLMLDVITGILADWVGLSCVIGLILWSC